MACVLQQNHNFKHPAPIDASTEVVCIAFRSTLETFDIHDGKRNQNINHKFCIQ